MMNRGFRSGISQGSLQVTSYPRVIKIRTEVTQGSIDVVLDVALHLAVVVVFVAIAVGRAPIHAFWHHLPLHCCYTSVMTVARNDHYSKLVLETMIKGPHSCENDNINQSHLS